MNSISTLDEILQLERDNDLKAALALAKRKLSKMRSAKKVALKEKEDLLLIMARLATKLNSEECLLYCDEVISHNPQKTPNEKSRYVRALISKGMFLYRKDDLVLAETTFKKAEKVLEAGEVEQAENLYGVLISNMATLYVRTPTTPNMVIAKQYFDKAIIIYRTQGQKQLLASAFINSSALAIELGAIDEAKASLDEAISLVREVGNLQSLCAALINRGRLSLEQGGYEEAMPMLLEALHLAHAHIPEQLSAVLTTMQMLCTAAHHPKSSLRLGDALLPIMHHNDDLHNPIMMFYCYLRQVEAALTLGEAALAESSLSEMKQYLPADASGEFQKVHLYLLARLDLLRKKSSAIVQFLKASKAQAVPSGAEGDIRIIVQTALARAEILAAYKPTLYCDEVVHLLQDVESALHVYAPIEKIDILRKLIFIYEKLGIQERFSHFSEEYNSLLDSINSRNNKENLDHYINSAVQTASLIKEEYLVRGLEHLKIAHAALQKEVIHLKQNNEEKQKTILSQRQLLRQIWERLSEIGTDDSDLLSLLNSLEAAEIENQGADAVTILIPPCPASLRSLLLQINQNLTPRELSFCHLTLQGYDIRQLGKVFNVSVAGVRKIRYRLARKLKVPSHVLFQQFLLDLSNRN